MYGGSGMCPIRSMASASGIPAFGPQSNRPAPMEVSRQNLAMHVHVVSFEQHTRTWFQFLPRMHQRFPCLGIRDSGFGSSEGLAVSAAKDTRLHLRLGLDDLRAARETRECRLRRADRRGAGDRSPARTTMCSMAPVCRESTSSRDCPRSAGGRWAISSSGRSKSKSLVRRDTGSDPFTVVHLREKKRSRFVRSFAASNGFQRSPSFAMRWRTLSILKSSRRTPFSSSFHATGVDTVARGLGRTE